MCNNLCISEHAYSSIVGNKSDEPLERREFESSEAKRVAERHHIPYIETSAKEGKNVDEVLTIILCNIKTISCRIKIIAFAILHALSLDGLEEIQHSSAPI